MPVDKLIYVDIGHNKARGATICVLEDTFKVFVHTNAGRPKAMEEAELLGAMLGGTKTSGDEDRKVFLIPSDQILESA